MLTDTMPHRLQDLRDKKGKSQTRMAEEIGINRRTISSWETGYREPNATCVKILADYFGCTTDYIIIGEKRCKCVPKR